MTAGSQREQAWHPGLVSAFTALDDAAVSWCLLRPPSVPAAPTGDVDLLVAAADLPACARQLGVTGFARLPDAGSPDQFFLRFDASTGCWLFLHVTTAIAFGRHQDVTIGVADACLRRRVRGRGAWFLAAEDEFWVTLFHVLIDKRAVPERYRARLASLAAEAEGNGPLARAIGEQSPPPWTVENVLACARAERWHDLERFGEAFLARWHERHRSQALRNRVRFFRRLAGGLANPWRRRGVSVALQGPDGAGKSTLAASLKESFFFPARILYMEVKDEELPRLGSWKLPGLAFATYLAKLCARLAVARSLQARGVLVIFDRYPYHAVAADPDATGVRRWVARWVLGQVFPRAGLTLVLDVPGTTMFARKGERSEVDLEAERQRLLALEGRVGGVEIVDATRPADEVLRDATTRIWRRYARRWAIREQVRGPELGGVPSEAGGR